MSDLTASAQQTDAGATGGTQPGAATPTAPQPEAPRFTQEDVNRMLADEKRKFKQQQDDAAAKIKREAEEKAALEKGEFEKLASERGARLQDAEAKVLSTTERLTAYEGVLTAQIKARIKALPEAARAKLPDGDPLSQLAWLDAVESAVAAALPSTPRPPLGTSPGPRGTGGYTATQTPDLVAAKRASGDYQL